MSELDFQNTSPEPVHRPRADNHSSNNHAGSQGHSGTELLTQVEAHTRRKFPHATVGRVENVITVDSVLGRHVRIEVTDTQLVAFVIPPSTNRVARPVHSVDRPLDEIDGALLRVEQLVSVHNLVRGAFARD